MCWIISWFDSPIFQLFCKAQRTTSWLKFHSYCNRYMRVVLMYFPKTIGYSFQRLVISPKGFAFTAYFSFTLNAIYERIILVNCRRDKVCSEYSHHGDKLRRHPHFILPPTAGNRSTVLGNYRPPLGSFMKSCAVTTSVDAIWRGREHCYFSIREHTRHQGSIKTIMAFRSKC